MRHFTITVVTLIAACLLLCPGLFVACRSQPRKAPNVILIVADTLRADHVGSYGYRRDTTKHIDALADHAYTFSNAYAQTPCTTPSMWNIVTSRYQSSMPAADEDTTLAEYFKSKHYSTAAFLAQHHLDGQTSNLQQGFDVYDQQSPRDRHGLSTRTAASVVDAAIAWLEQERERPFFAWLVFYDPHDPYGPPEDFKGYYTTHEGFSRDRRADGLHGLNNDPISREEKEFLIAAYDEEIRYFDHELGRFLEYVKGSGEYDDTLILLTSDHGEELGDHGNRWDHCQLLSQEEIWVPLLAKMPRQTQGVVRDEAVQHIDIYPTLVEYLDGSDLPELYNALEGNSLLPLIEGRQPPEDRFAAAFWSNQQALIKGGYKVWLHGEEEIVINIRDHGEGIKTAALDGMKKQLSEIYERHFVRNERYDEIIEQLSALGYIHE